MILSKVAQLSRKLRIIGRALPLLLLSYVLGFPLRLGSNSIFAHMTHLVSGVERELPSALEKKKEVVKQACYCFCRDYLQKSESKKKCF